MDVAVQRTDTQRLQPNGPRVSFNRDVHVKRIGKRLNENTNYPIQTTNLQPPNTQHLRRELPADLSKESILKEAARVIAQAESVKCKAQANEILPKQLITRPPSALSKNIKNQNTIPEKFHSLPTRKKKTPKLVSRSVSDASSKKSKKPSIFNLFSRKSDSNLSQIERNHKFDNNNSDRRLIRSKSDASSQKYRRDKFHKTIVDKEEIPLNSISKVPAQLSPIIENSQKEDYFEEQFNKERRKSDTGIQNTENELHSFLNKPKSGNIGYTNNEELDLIPAKLNTSHHIKDTITSLVNKQNSKSFADMHSSQLPPEKPVLTKGLTVDGMVKRLSMERFSPPPTILGPAFSYTRPNERIIYAQIASDEEKFKKHEISPLHDSESFKYQTRDIPLNGIKVSSHNPRCDHPKRSYSPPQRITMSRNPHHSPSPWRQLSPRNLSDEDEGLGNETKKYFEDDLQNTFDNDVYKRKQSPSFEIPIIPVLHRSSSPMEHSPSRHGNFDEMNTLRHRREVLESRITNRRFGGAGGQQTNDIKSNRFMRDFSPEKSTQFHRDYLSADREDYNKFHKLNTKEVLNKYSPDRTHLDMIAPTKESHHISGYTHTKYYDDGIGGGVKEIYRKETKLDENGKPYVRESRRRERIEPKNLQNLSPERLNLVDEPHSKDEFWQGSLKRDKRQQRSFDKGDSGIENDIRKESFNGNKNSKWRKRNVQDDIKACELFIKKERFHTDEQHPQRKRLDYVYRERSIDDGSHFDPRLDKYPKTITQKSNIGGNSRLSSPPDAINREKKIGSFERMRKLFATNNSSRKKENQNPNGSVGDGIGGGGKSNESPPKDRYMVKEDEMRSRYYEHKNGIGVKTQSKTSNIATRRRLSTPKASPLLKRTSSEKTPQRSPLTASNSKETKAEKSGWFKSLERRSKIKSKNKLENTSTEPIEKSSTLRVKESNTSPLPPTSIEALSSKNLRFFGDTDLDSNPPTISRITSTPRKRSSISPLALNNSQTFSKSAYHLDRVSPVKSVSNNNRSSSLQNLDEGTDEIDIGNKRRYNSRGRDLDDISESGSESEDKTQRSYKSNLTKLSSSRDRLERSYKHDENKSSSRSPQKELTNSNRIETRRPLLGPIKPARSADKKFSSNSKDRDRIPDSSGTEGDSSLHSQRSVVYLHATTIGAIPQPYMGSRRRAVSRDDLRRNKQQPLEPMTRTVSRSVSMLAPWKPKHISEGYEINYSQEQDNAKATMTMPRSKKSNLSSSRDKSRLSREDMTLNRHSSSTSPSKSGLSTSSYRNVNKRQTDDLVKDTLGRRRIK